MESPMLITEQKGYENVLRARRMTWQNLLPLLKKCFLNCTKNGLVKRNPNIEDSMIF